MLFSDGAGYPILLERLYHQLVLVGLKLRTMKVSKLSISFDLSLGSQVREAARKARVPVSTWLAQAAVAKLRADALGEFLDDWERRHVKLGGHELARAERELAPPMKNPRN
jgi:hypothetical protein